MDARPEIPDPQHDRHVAFSDDAPEPLPESWWAPAPAPAPSPVRGAQGSRFAPQRRRRVGWWAVVAVFLFGSAMSGHSGELFGHGGTGHGGIAYGSAEGEGPAPSSIELVAEPVAPSGAVDPVDAALYPIPPGTLWFRLEVVGNDPRGTVDVMASSGSTVSAGEVALPYAARLTRNDPDDPLTVTVHGAYGQQQVQCRVYLADALVAIGTGPGTATCEVPGGR